MLFFFCNSTPTTEIYTYLLTLALHDALPISDGPGRGLATGRVEASRRSEAGRAGAGPPRRAPDALWRAARRPGPADRLDKPDDRVLAEPVRRPRRPAEKDGSMNVTSDRKSGGEGKSVAVRVVLGGGL